MKLILLWERGTLVLLALVSLLLLATVGYVARIARGRFAALHPSDGTGTFAPGSASSTVHGNYADRIEARAAGHGWPGCGVTDCHYRHRRMQ
jgi:hypothetical protein